MIVKHDITEWEVKEVSRYTFLKENARDGGFYLDVTEDVECDVETFSAVFWGQRNTLFCMSVDMSYDITYYIGKLKDAQETI